MTDRRTWAVRFQNDGKQPRSPFSTRPIEYEPKTDEEHADAWLRRWNDRSILGTYEQALSCLNRHDRAVGLTHVVHHWGEHEPATRLIVLDYDDAIQEGKLDATVRGHVELWQTYTTFSGSKTGLHVWLLVKNCPAFRNQLVVPVSDGVTVDILCCNPVAATGEVFEDYKDLMTVDWADLELFPLFVYKPPTKEHEVPEWWTDDPIEAVPTPLVHLIPTMEAVPAIEGQGGSKVLFAAACELLRHGVTGREAEALLRCVPAVPEFPPEQIQRTLECAFQHVQSDGDFGVLAEPCSEFDVLDDDAGETSKNPWDEREKRYGFRVYSAAELDGLDLTMDYAVDGAFVGEGALYVGGREKSFKTGITTDLMYSLTTQTPFLNYFDVNRLWRGAFFTAETGLVKTQIMLRAIAHSRGRRLADLENLDISDNVPKFDFNKHTGQFVNKTAIAKLKLYIKERQPDVAVIDPLYFAIGAASVGDMYEVGKILREISDFLTDHGVWPILCHHSKKDSNAEFEPMTLNDFYGSGVGAHARQWILMSHAEPYNEREGVARLFANIGGSTQGARGVYNVTVHEGRADMLMDRTWDVETTPMDEAVNAPKRTRFLDALRGNGEMSIGDVALRANLSETDVKNIVADLMADDSPILELRNKKITLLDSEF